MAGEFIQLEGPVKLGADSGTAVDYSDEVPSCIVRRNRETVRGPSTYGRVKRRVKAGAVAEEVTLIVLNDIAAARLWAELWDAIDTDDGDLYFECTLTDAAVGADNPKFSGRIIVTGVEVGGQAGQFNTQTWTFPVDDDGLTKAVV